MKKINSELKFNNDIFKIKIGTTDKKNPEAIYIEIGTYISPKEEKKSYKDDIFSIDSELRKIVETFLQNTSHFNSEFILITDCPYERIIRGKNSYCEFQLFVKPLKFFLGTKKFSEIAKSINDVYMDNILSIIKSKLESKGFYYCKTRK